MTREFDLNIEISTSPTAVREQNKSFEYDFVDYENLTEEEKKVYSYTQEILELTGSKMRSDQIFISNRMAVDSEDQTLGVYQHSEDRIIIDRKQLENRRDYFGTLIHELTHADSGYGDISREFESHLTKHIGTLADKVFYERENNTAPTGNDTEQTEKEPQISVESLKQKTNEELEQIGKHLSGEGKFDEALPVYDELISRTADEDYYYKRSVLLHNVRRFKEALESAEQTLEFDSASAKYHALKGRILCEMGDVESGLKSLTYAHSLNETDADIMYITAIYYFGQKEYDNALMWLKRAEVIEPKRTEILVDAIKVLFAIENYNECVNYCDKAIKVSPDMDVLYYYKGLALHKLYDRKEAYKCIQKAVELNPKENRYYIALGAFGVNRIEGIRLTL